MKRTLKKAMSVLLAFTLLFGSLAFGLSDLNFVDFAVKAEAAETFNENDFWYTVDENGNATITGVDDSISGDIVVPLTLGGYTVTVIDCIFRNCSELRSVVIPDGIMSIGGFNRCDNLTQVTIAASVTSIGVAFRGCYALTNITVDSANSVFSSDEYGVLFNKDKTELIQYPAGNSRASYVIPDGVKTISDYAFEGCTSIESIIISDTVEVIDTSAFCNCDSLENVFLGNSVRHISYNAFENCDSLTTVDIPASVTSIYDNAFYDCDSLTRITVDPANIAFSSDEFGVLFDKTKTTLLQYPEGNVRECYEVPDNVTAISYNAFSYNNNPKMIMIDPANPVYSSDEYGVVFNKDKTELIMYPVGNPRTTYVIPDGVTSIAAGSFAGCFNLSSVTIPDGVISIGAGAFFDTKIYDNEANWENGVLYIGNYLIKAKEPDGDSYSVKAGTKVIADYAFDWIPGYGSVELPDGLKSIGNGAFYNSALESIIIPDSVISIGDEAFNSCDSLLNVIIGDNITNIGQDAFLDTGIYNDVSNWENDVLYIGKYLIDTKDSISGSYSIKAGTKGVAESAFYDRENLSEIIIPDSVVFIGDFAFVGCTLSSVTIPESVLSIGDFSFKCRSLNKIIVDNANPAYSSDEYGVLFNKDKTELKQYPVGNARANYEMPDSVKIIEDESFSNCEYLESISISDNAISIEDNAFLFCVSLTNIKIPDSVTCIGSNAFLGCQNLESVDLGNGVTIIEAQSFVHCNSLADIIIGDSLKFIESTVFTYCYSLRNVYYTGTEEEWNAIIINGKQNEELLNATICFNYVPEDPSFPVPPIDPEPGTPSDPTPPEDPTPSVCGHETTSTVTIAATCKVEGMEYVVCATCGEKVGEPVVLPVIPHTTVTVVTVEPTCTKEGKEHDECSACGDILSAERTTAKLPHTPGEWETETEPTAEKEGKRVRKCTVCGETADEEIIPKKTVVTDDNTGVAIEINDGDYDGDVSIEVKESFDGAAFNLINTETDAAQSLIYDIKLTVDGKETQPNGKVTVRIPVPDGYDPNRSFVYHVDTKTGKLEKMNTRFENGCLVFETTHFSYYAVVEEAKTSLEIRKPSTSTVKYGETLILHADFTNIPEGATIEWSVEGKGVTIVPSADGKTCAVTSTATGDVTITAKYVDVNGVEYISEQEIKSNASFWQKIVSFFKNLFGISRIIEQVIKF